MYAPSLNNFIFGKDSYRRIKAYMWRMKLDILILCTIEIIFQESWCYYVSNTTFTLTKKSNNCEIATPAVQYGNQKLTVDMNGHSIKKEVWVCYYQQTALFEYIGCMSSEDLQIPKIQLGTPNIGRCYSACSNTPFIGIQRKECYCISDKPVISSIRNPNCNAGCSVFYNAACGGDKVISLYRMLPHNGKYNIFYISYIPFMF
ncbi:uncharacterized protein LOC132734904 [Ruditapes philippinarum]|uniref:uncharacterized protein LOC132734904 n=1 Tax=Ruditapes philippinarum TaxID=129788 RepID=UPI00295B95AA|nr:uncharacterized protein LOC132734904 [Ruditapes philippinarum]